MNASTGRGTDWRTRLNVLKLSQQVESYGLAVCLMPNPDGLDPSSRAV